MRAGSSGPRLWVFDFDGTLSPIVADRAAAQLHPASRALLADLACDPANHVAVLSSRALEDLVPRVRVPRVVLGGGSGLAWRIPGGHRILPGEATERRLEGIRRQVLPVLGRLAAFPGVEIEDKRWSMAVHFRRVLPEAMPMLFPLLDELDRQPGIRVYAGPLAAEVQFLRSVNKSFGVRRLCRLLGFTPGAGRLFYAGDDESDAVAMQWVLSRKGTAFAVGKRVRVAGALSVDGPVSLARVVRAQAGLEPRRRKRIGGREAAG